ncbi:hypothetical protein BGZ76_006170, partial [Entomortierella beljakovae]
DYFSPNSPHPKASTTPPRTPPSSTYSIPPIAGPLETADGRASDGNAVDTSNELPAQLNRNAAGMLDRPTPTHLNPFTAGPSNGLPGPPGATTDALPTEDEACLSCLFKDYQRLCAGALTNDQLKITDMADVLSLMGVFVPSRPTERMRSFFTDESLEASIKSGAVTTAEWDAAEFDDRLAMKAVKDDIATALLPMNKDHRAIHIMLETLLEYLPKDEDRSVSEYEYTVKYIGPVMQAFFKSKTVTSHFPNKDSVMQKRLGLKPNRPDFTATAGKREIAWGEFSGPAHENDSWKNAWDFFHEVRYGKAFLDSGFKTAPLFQVVYEVGNYMRLQAESRGMYILHEVGKFTIPTTIAKVPSLIATFSTLLIAK